ncbi:hypothetical protein SB00033_01784 [Klebsiella quasivariicola]|nr:Uncharacterised protein [Klebsiella quasivariicola]VGP03524.1 hypothetical protein SB00033_01784 [Klebsiella quasivariicola]
MHGKMVYLAVSDRKRMNLNSESYQELTAIHTA